MYKIFHTKKVTIYANYTSYKLVLIVENVLKTST